MTEEKDEINNNIVRCEERIIILNEELKSSSQQIKALSAEKVNI